MKKKTVVFIIMICLFLICITVPAFALTEEEMQNAVNGSSKEAVSGNFFIWFLCAIAFLKVSQKIDSFMSSLGINVGNTGGSMLAEAMIAARGIGVAGKALSGSGGFSFRGFGKGGNGSSSAGAGGGNGFSGTVGRKFAAGAMQNVTGQDSGLMSSIGRKMFDSSMVKGGGFANSVISIVAKGDISKVGSIKGDTAKAAMASYFGYGTTKSAGQAGTVADVVKGSGASSGAGTSIPADGGIDSSSFGGNMPQFSDVEIGGGRITGIETSDEYPSGSSFAMYSADKYDKPQGDFQTVTATDKSQWYKQYAKPYVEKTPYMDAAGKVKYNEKITSKLPPVPPRRDKV